MIVLKNTPVNQIFYIMRNAKNESDCWDLTHSTVEFNSNGTYTIAAPKGYDGLSSVTVKVDVEGACTGIETSESEINSAKEGGEHIIGISSSSAWTATASEDWITVTPNSGEGGVAVITITVSENEGGERTGTVTIVNDNGDVNVIDIVQTGRLSEYLTIEALSDGDLLFSYVSEIGQHYKEIEYSIDKNNWNSVTSSETPSLISNMTAGDIIYLRGDNTAYAGMDRTRPYENRIIGDNGLTVKLSGNIMSLIQKEGFDQLDELTEDYTFSSLFQGLDVVDAGALLLPATVLSERCYSAMFRDSVDLTVCPELPATTLAEECYSFMFRGCTSLETAPELPVTTLADSCYQGMFEYCESLISAPELPATETVYQCYADMFQGCSSLTTAPELPATIINNHSYAGMFQGCSSLNYIKCLAVQGFQDGAYTVDWTKNVAAQGTFVKDANANWPTNAPWYHSGIPSGWTVETI